MYKITVDNDYYVKVYEVDIFGRGVIDFTDDENNAGKFSEAIAREICCLLRHYGKDTEMKRIKISGGNIYEKI